MNLDTIGIWNTAIEQLYLSNRQKYVLERKLKGDQGATIRAIIADCEKEENLETLHAKTAELKAEIKEIIPSESFVLDSLHVIFGGWRKFVWVGILALLWFFLYGANWMFSSPKVEKQVQQPVAQSNDNIAQMSDIIQVGDHNKVKRTVKQVLDREKTYQEELDQQMKLFTNANNEVLELREKIAKLQPATDAETAKMRQDLRRHEYIRALYARVNPLLGEGWLPMSREDRLKLKAKVKELDDALLLFAGGGMPTAEEVRTVKAVTGKYDYVIKKYGRQGSGTRNGSGTRSGSKRKEPPVVQNHYSN